MPPETPAGPPPEFFLFLGGLLALIALGLAAIAVQKLLRAGLVEKTPAGRVASALRGLVRLSGAAATPPGEPLQSPLSGASCVWYSYRVSKPTTGPHFHDSDGHHHGMQRRIVRRGRSDAPFLLRDETGVALVDPKGAEVITSRGGTTFRGPIAANQAQADEELILEGTTVLVLGELQAGGASDRVADTLRRWKKDGELVARFDANGDGRIDDAEMAQARAEAKREAQGEPRVIGKPASGPYLISTLSAEALASSLRSSAVSYFLFAGGFGALATWLIRMG
ncbi:MAG: GIDE domain-containing protein [Myxococcales bacterium]